MSYATVADLMFRYDLRDLGELASDDGTAVTPVDLPGNVNIQACLDDASGEIDAALFANGRYSAADLVGLTGNSLAYLKRMTCDIAMAFIYARRPLYDPDKYKAATENAEAHLKKLHDGDNVFNLTAQIAAGQPQIDGPSTMTFQNLNLMRDRTLNYYPRRSLPYNR